MNEKPFLFFTEQPHKSCLLPYEGRRQKLMDTFLNVFDVQVRIVREGGEGGRLWEGVAGSEL